MSVDVVGAILILVNVSGHPMDIPLSLQRETIRFDSLPECVDKQSELNYELKNNTVYRYDCIPTFKKDPFRFW